MLACSKLRRRSAIAPVVGLVIGLSLGCTLVFVASGARAQTAQELSTQGSDALRAGRYADAVKAFDAAYRAQPAPTLLYNLGLAYKGMGFPGKAQQALEAFVSYADEKTEAANIAAARAEIEKLKNGYARFAVKLTPASATIDIDGKRVAPENNELWVAIGKHTISIKADGHESYEQALEVAAGRFDLEVTLRAATMPPADRAAMLIEEGVALETAGDKAGALGKYQQAESVQSTARGLGQRGLVEEQLGELPDAELHIKASIALKKDKWVRKNKPKLNKALRRIGKQLADLEITGEPQGAEVLVNERVAGTLPIIGIVRAQIGSVTVQARKSGYAMFEETFDLPKKGKRTVVVSMEQAPVPVPVVVPPPVAQPAEPAPVEPIPIEPIKIDEPMKVAEAPAYDPRDDLTDDEDPQDLATGFEAVLNFGYHPGIGGPDLEGSTGTLTGQILLGARIIWPLSFGVSINGGFNLSNEGTSVVAAAHPGLYVRGHLQQYKKQLAVDLWGGVGVQPMSLQVAVVEPDEELDPGTVDPMLVTGESVARLLATRELGAERIHTLQTLNIPVEIGATLFLTPAVGLDLSLGLTFWVPIQDCLHDNKDNRYCATEGLDMQTSFFIGGGLSFLP
jgi:tetratricopeptide (TPR) repeat protein